MAGVVITPVPCLISEISRGIHPHETIVIVIVRPSPEGLRSEGIAEGAKTAEVGLDSNQRRVSRSETPAGRCGAGSDDGGFRGRTKWLAGAGGGGQHRKRQQKIACDHGVRKVRFGPKEAQGAAISFTV